MSLYTHDLDWTVTPSSSGSGGGTLAGGVYRYQLQGSRLSDSSNPSHLPQSARYTATLVVAGACAGLPSASWSYATDPSTAGQLHYLNVGAQAGRCASEFIGEGCIIDFSAGGGSIHYGQIVVFDTGMTIIGAPAHMASRFQHALDSAHTLGQVVTHYLFRPPSSWVWVSGLGSGVMALGATLSTGAVDVRE